MLCLAELATRTRHIGAAHVDTETLPRGERRVITERRCVPHYALQAYFFLKEKSNQKDFHTERKYHLAKSDPHIFPNRG